MTMNIMKVKEEVEEIIKTGNINEIRKEVNEKLEKIEKKYSDIVIENKKIETQLSVNKSKPTIVQTQTEKERIFRKQTKLTENEIQQLEKWTKLKCSEIVFDSNVDDWSQNTSELNRKIKGKKQLIFLIEDEDGEKFGYYLNSQVDTYYNQTKNTDNKSFEFNLESHGRLDYPMKFEIKNLYRGGCYLFEKSVYE